MNSKNNYYIFDFEQSGIKTSRLFDTNLDSRKLLHLHFETKDYYLLIWVGINNSNHHIQYNEGVEFTEFLKNNGVSYQRFDIAKNVDIHDSKLKLTNGQTIEFETSANGTWESLDIYDVTSDREHPEIFSSAKATFNFDEIDLSVELSWQGLSENDIPSWYKDLQVQQEKKEKRTQFIVITLIVIIAIVIYWIYYR